MNNGLKQKNRNEKTTRPEHISAVAGRVVDAVDDAVGEALGNITEFASTREKKAEWRYKNKVGRYDLLDAARELLPNERVHKCLRIPVHGARKESSEEFRVRLFLDSESGRAHLKGVGVCGSPWTCPICSAKISLGRRQELELGMAAARALGWYVVFITLTSRHSREDSALEMKEKTRAAMRKLKAGRWWQENIKSLGLNGTITGLDVTYGHANGWHIHDHALFMFDKLPDLKELEEKLFVRWLDVLASVGLDCDREHGVMVLPGNKAANYVAKWGLENELSSGDYKKARDGHYTTFDLLREYKSGSTWAGEKFQEFASAFKGAHQLRWSKGLKDKLGVNVASDQELAEVELSEDSKEIASLTWREYMRVFRKGSAYVAKMLLVAERGSMALFTWLLYECNIFLEPG